MLAGTFAVSYAGDTNKLAYGKCGARITLVLDRSSSIGVSQFEGSQANVDKIKSASQDLFNAVKGPDSYTDVITFASVAERSNTGGWFHVKDQAAANWQSMVTHGIPFKVGATNESSGNRYWDGLPASNEGLTNWEGALNLAISSQQHPFPDAIIFFTDGYPTTNQNDVKNAIATGSGLKDLTDPQDINPAIASAKFIRGIGTKIIPVAVGLQRNSANLQALAGAGNPVYASESYNDLSRMLREAAADVCKPPVTTTTKPTTTTTKKVTTTTKPTTTTTTVPKTPTIVAISAQEKLANGTLRPIQIPVTTSGLFNGSILTTGSVTTPWATKTVNVAGDWDFRMRAQIPEGYRPIAERCERDKFSGTPPILAEKEDSVGVNGHILLRDQPKGGTTYCEFLIEKIPVTPTSTLKIIATDVATGNHIGAKFNHSNSPFPAGQFDTTPNPNVYATKTAKPTVNWGFNTSWVTSSTPGYKFDSAKCSPSGIEVNNGINSATNGYEPGVTVTCEYFFKRLPAAPAKLTIVKSANGQDAPANNPVALRVGDKVTYSFSIQNTGQIPVKNINLVDATLTSQRSDALTDCRNALSGKVLAVGEIFTCNAREITVPVGSPQTVRNVATASGTGVVLPGQDPSNPPQVSDDANIKIVKPIVSIDKKVNPSLLTYDGQSVTYTITAKNTGDATYDGTITDAKLGINKTVSIAPNGGTVTITVTGKFKLSDKTITFKKSENPDLPSDKTVSIESNSFTNTACLKEINLCDNADLIVADLAITKTALPTNLVISQNGKYEISIKNTGKADLKNVVIKDDSLKTLFANANDGVNNNVKTQYFLTDSGVSCNGSQDSILEIGETCTVNINYTMTQKLFEKIKGDSTSNSVSFKNTAVVTGDTVIATDGGSLTRSDDATITVTSTPSLTINKTVSSKIVSKAGDTVTYIITVENKGNGNASNVVVYERGLGINFGPYDIAAGQKKVINITATFDGDNTLTFTKDGQVVTTKTLTDSKFKNIACLSPTGTDPCSPEVTVYKPGLKVEKTANATDYSVGDNVVYTFKLTNTGATALGNVTLNDTTIPALFSSAGESNPPKTSFVGANFNGDVNGNGFLDLTETWSVNATFKLTQKLANYIDSHDSNNVLAGAQFKNIAVAKGDVVTPGTNNVDTSKPVGPVQDDAEITVTLTPGLEVTKITSKSVAVDGDTFKYTITVKNVGTSVLNNVAVNDDNVGFTTTIPTLNVGQSISFVIDATVSGNTISFKYNGTPTTKTAQFDNSGVFTNVACATVGDIKDCSPDVKVKTPKVTLDKTVKGNSTVHIGETITYRFVVTNVNEVPVKDLVITDASLQELFGLDSIPTINIDNSKLGADGVLTKGEKSQVVEYTTPVITKEIAAKFANNAFTNIAVVNGKAVLEDGTTKPIPPAQDDAIVNLELRTGWTFAKEASSHTARPGDTITYTFTVKNTGETVIPSVTVTDNTIGKTVVIEGPIAVGATKTGSTTYVLPTDYAGTNFKNNATACITGTQDCKPGTDTVYVPKIKLDKSGPNVAFAGDKVTYKFKVTNIGETDLTNIVIKDTTLSTLLGKDVTINVPETLKPGESSNELTYDAVIPSTYTGTSFKNTAVVTAIPVDPKTKDPVPSKPVTDDDDHTISLAKWHATKTADKTAIKAGETVNYVITVFNDSDVDLKNVEVSDPTIGFPQDGKPVVVDVPANSKVEIKASYVVPADFTGDTFKNVALVCVPRTGQDKDCDKPEVEIPVVKIQIVKTADKTQAVVGDELTFTFALTNKSTIDLTNVRVIDAKVNFDQVIPLLKAGETITVVATNKYVVTQADLDSGKLTNIVSACAKIPGHDGPDATDCTPPPACADGDENCTPPTGVCVDKPGIICDDDTITIPVVNPAITIVKTADAETANVGDSVNYTFLITNISNIEIRDITVNDNVIGLIGVIESLAPGASATKTVSYVIPAGVPGGVLRNVATACFEAPVVATNCDSDDHVLTVTQVGGESVTRVGGISRTLPFTGSTTDMLLKAVLWLMLLGSGFVLITRRKPREA